MKPSAQSVVIESMENRLFFDASQLSEAIVASTLPAQISDQTVAHGKVTIDVTNNSATLQKYRGVVDVATTTDSTFDPQSYSEFNLGGKNTSFNLASGVTKQYVIPVNIKKGELQDFTYGLYAFVADVSQQYSVSGPTGTLTVAPPVVTLSETQTFVKLPSTLATAGGKLGATDKIAITNSGTDASSTALTIDVYATPDGVASDGTPFLAVPLTKKIQIKAGKTANVTVKLPTFPTVTDGTYSVIAQVTQTTGTVTQSDATVAPTVVVGTATTGGGGTGGGGTGGGGTTTGITATVTSESTKYDPDYLQGEFQHVTEIDTNLSIVNNGTATSTGDTFELFASTSSTFDSSAFEVSTLSLPVSLVAGGTRTLAANFGVPEDTSKENGNDYNYYIFVEVTDTAGNTSVASYAQQIQFYGLTVDQMNG